MTNTRKRNPSATRQRLIEAAGELACTEGTAKLSLDAVAARAGVSKGGLLYHFPSKNDLLRGMVASHIDRLREKLEEAAPGALAGQGEALPAIAAYLRLLGKKMCRPDKAAPGLLGAIMEDPAFLEPLLRFRGEVEALFRRHPDADRARLAFMACEGLAHIRLTDPMREMEADFVTVLGAVARLLGVEEPEGN